MKTYLLLVLVLLTPSAHAYVDPGSSLLILQGVFAVLGAILIYIRHPIQTTKSLLRRFKKSNTDTDHA